MVQPVAFDGPAMAAADPAAWHYGPGFDPARAEAQHAELARIVAASGAEIHWFPSDADGLSDAVFVQDPSFVTRAGAVLLNMGKALRKNEPRLHREIYESLQVPVIGQLTGEATVESGDCVWIDPDTLAIGRGARTNQAGIEAVEAELGPIDVVVANAGITRDAPFHKMTPQQWKEVVDTNLTGVFNTVHPCWPGMRERGFGRVVVISSINGQKGQFGQVNYAATKAGDLGIVKSLAQEGAAKGITANAICPGYIATDMVMAVPEKVREAIIGQIPTGRLGEPEEIARCVVFLASDDAGFINGSTITANGGQFFV